MRPQGTLSLSFEPPHSRFVPCRIDIINSGERDHQASFSTNEKRSVSAPYILLWKLLDLLLQLMHLNKFSGYFGKTTGLISYGQQSDEVG